MNEQLISFDTAVLAKEKGFDFSEVKIRDSNTLEIADNVEARLDYFETMEESNLIQLPTQSLLQKWLRDEHDIRVYVTNKVAGDFGFEIYIVNPQEDKRIGKPWVRLDSFWTLHFKTYEEALEEGLQKTLKLIPN